MQDGFLNEHYLNLNMITAALGAANGFPPLKAESRNERTENADWGIR